jgi:hypothetical protein
MAKAKFGNAGFSFRGCRVGTANLPEEFWAMAIATDERTLSGDGIARSPALDGLNGAWNGVSWSAVIAGAFTAIAVSIIVIALGTGIGMEVVSPYSSSSSPSAGTMTVIGALWLVFAQAVGFAVGGYVAGRLRRPPAAMHSSEVKFRDGANGLVVWAIGVVVGSLILAGTINKIGSAAGTALTGAATVGIGGAGSQAPSMDYFTDMLLRPTPQGMTNQSTANQGTANNGAANGAANGAGGAGGGSSAGNNNQERGQIYRIMVTSLGPNGISNDDSTYLAQVVAAQTGLSQQDAQNRVNDVINQAKQDATQAADAARKAAAYVSFWTFMSLLFGAACATLGGVLGGDLRDDFAIRQAVPTSPR